MRAKHPVVRGGDASLVCHLIREDLSPTGNCINEETCRDSEERARDRRPGVITPLGSPFLYILASPPSPMPAARKYSVAWQLLRSRLTSANNGETLISCDWARRTAATKATSGVVWRGEWRVERWSLSLSLSLSLSPSLSPVSSRRIPPRASTLSRSSIRILSATRWERKGERERQTEREGERKRDTPF